MKARFASTEKPLSRIEKRIRPGRTAVQEAGGAKSILVPIDFSEMSEQTFRCAVKLAERLNAKLDIIHVVEPPAIFNDTRGIYGQWDQSVKRARHQRLTQLRRREVPQPLLGKTKVFLGRAHREICRTAKQFGSDLIVIGTHGRSGVSHLFLGSVAEKVIRHAPCPVLVIRKNTNPDAFDPKTILVPTDFSPGSKAALKYALDAAQRVGGLIKLLHVIPTNFGETYSAADAHRIQLDLEHASDVELSRIVGAAGDSGVPIQLDVRRGRPATEIIAAAENADLVALSTHGYTGLKHVLLGSTTEEVVRHATVPVLVVRNL